MSHISQSVGQSRPAHRICPNVDKSNCNWAWEWEWKWKWDWRLTDTWCKSRPHVVRDLALTISLSLISLHLRFRLRLDTAATGTWAQPAAASQRGHPPRRRLPPVQQPLAAAPAPGRPAVHQQERGAPAELLRRHHGHRQRAAGEPGGDHHSGAEGCRHQSAAHRERLLHHRPAR